jgi:hypothetical protein
MARFVDHGWQKIGKYSCKTNRTAEASALSGILLNYVKTITKPNCVALPRIFNHKTTSSARPIISATKFAKK